MNVNDANFIAVPTIQQRQEVSKTNGKQLQKETHNKEKVPNKTEVQETVDKFNRFLNPDTTNLKFIFHEDLQQYYVTVVDPLTDEVIREIPPKKMLDMYHAMTQYMGLLVDTRI